MKLGRPARWALLVVLTVVVALQMVPYGERRNPATTGEPLWNTRTTREVAVGACYDCHSNQTAWPWYSAIAPVRWFVYRDVTAARAAMNFSEFDRLQWGPSRVAEMVRTGQMPPPRYAALHRAARLTPDDRDALASGLAATVGPQQRQEITDGPWGVGIAD